MIFLLSSTGIVVFESHCSCSGNESFSLYITPETCDENYHVHHSHDNAGNEIETEENMCHECTSHMQDCGCSSPEVKYLKLVNQLIDDEVKFINLTTTQNLTVGFVTELLQKETAIDIDVEKNYIDPPPLIKSSFDFLIQINKLKIPELA